MNRIANKITDLIGHTPLLRLSNYVEKRDIKSEILVKLESFNPAGCVKERIALAMIEDAESRGVLKKGMTIVESTSGNTGIGLAMVAAAKGYKIILTMPDTMSVERRKILKAYGAELILTSGKEGMKGAIQAAEELKKGTNNIFIPQQFENPANPQIHAATTAEEIWADTKGKIDIVVAGVGTGGTISGVGRKLKSYNPAIKMVAVEPIDSAVLSGGKPGPHKIQGIGAGFIPKNYDKTVVNEILTVSNEEAMSATRSIGKEEGVLIGISSGAAIYAATLLSQRAENKNKTIVVILPDAGDRYLSTELFLESN